MSSLFFILCIVSTRYVGVHCSPVTPSRDLRMANGPLDAIVSRNYINQLQNKQVTLSDLLFPKEASTGADDLTKNGNIKLASTNRKSKILRTLAFLAGLGVGDLAGAASNNVKTYAKVPAATLNFSAFRPLPHVASIYDPYLYALQPYIITPPIRYALSDFLLAQATDGMQNTFQPLSQNLQLLSLLDNKKQTDLLSNNEEYIEEAKKVENVKTLNNAGEEIDGSATLRVKDDRNAEAKRQQTSVACGAQDASNKQDNLLKSATNIHENDSSLTILSSRATNKTAENTTKANMTNTTMTNSTMNNNETTTPFHGYYGGYPQDINHIDFTTEATEYKYHDYEYVNYNLPPHEKPANFYPNENNNYYSNSPVNLYPPTQFHQDHVPEYVPNDFNKFLYSPENTPPFFNGFRPVL